MNRSIKIPKFNFIAKLLVSLTQISLGIFLASILNLILTSFLAKNIPIDDFGSLVLLLTIAGLVINVLFAGVSNGAARVVVDAHLQNNLPAFYLTVTLVFRNLTVWLLLISSSLILLSMIFFPNDKSIIYNLILIISTSILMSIYGSINQINSSLQKRIFVSSFQILEALTKLVMVLIVTTYFIKSPTYQTVISCYLYAAFFCLFVQMLVLHNEGNFKFNKNIALKRLARQPYLHDIFNVGTPYIKWGLFTWFAASVDKWVISYFGDNSDVGIYALMFQISYVPLIMACGVINTYAKPKIFYSISNNDIKNSIRIIIASKMFCIAIALLFCVAMAIFVEDIILLVASEKYLAGQRLYIPLILSACVFSITVTANAYVEGRKKTTELLSIKIVGSTLTVVCIVIGGYLYQTIGVSWGLFIGLLISYFWSLWNNWR